MDNSKEQKKDKDFTVKKILIAVLCSIGIGVVFITLSSGTLNHTLKVYLWNAGYSATIGLGLFANGWFFRKIRVRFIDWFARPIRSVFIVLLTHFTYSTIIILAFNAFWFLFVYGYELNTFWKFGRSIIVGEYIVVAIITIIFYARGFFDVWREKAIEGEKLKNEALQLQYQVLQNQVNPHFLFNTLNVLGALIDIDSEKAKHFTRELSMFYRDLLDFKDKELVDISEEIDFVKRYITLQQIRFNENLNVDIVVSNDFSGKIIPMSIQMLLENAIKHNEVSKSKPLQVVIGVKDEDFIFVENNRQPKDVLEPGNNIGLSNLKERYRFLTDHEVEVINNGQFFRVTLPIIKLS